jgi:hypothetical protein
MNKEPLIELERRQQWFAGLRRAWALAVVAEK